MESSWKVRFSTFFFRNFACLQGMSVLKKLSFLWTKVAMAKKTLFDTKLYSHSFAFLGKNDTLFALHMKLLQIRTYIFHLHTTAVHNVNSNSLITVLEAFIS